MIKAILFDMDGVLVDAREWHYEAFNRALEIFGMKISLDNHLSTFDGLPTRRKLQILAKSRGLSVGLHDFINELKQSYTQEIIAARCKPSFHHQFALSRLQRRGYRMAVCSNSIRNTVKSMMDLAQLTSYFELMLSNEDVEKPKPNPEIYLTAINRLGFKPPECIVVEDNENGIQAARDSGAHVVVVGSAVDVTFDRLMAEICTAEAA